MTILSVTRRLAIVSLAGTLVAVTAREIRAVSSGRPSLAAPSSGATQASTPVRTLPGAQRFGAKPGEKGATYYWLEGQIRRLTTRFADAVVVADRGGDGDFSVRIQDSSGNETGRFKVDRVDESTHLLQYTGASGLILQALAEPSMRPTLDWANQQAYSLWKDRVAAGDTLSWQNGLMRPAGAATRDLEHEIVELRTDWANGLSASAVRRRGVRLEVMPGRFLHGEAVISRVTRDDVEVGISNWFPEQQFFLWDLPGMSEGYLDPTHLASIGGWQFQPDIAWVNLQTIAFHHFKTLLNEQGTVAERRATFVDKISNLFVAPLHANEEGCDGLHWLDGTIYRYCCDTHDYCYSKYGCSASSWWQWWSSWTCDACNVWVVWCIADTAEFPMQHSPY